MSDKKSSPRLEDVDLSQAIDSEDQYQQKLTRLQRRISDLAIACFHNKHRVIILYEGWDAAGKGGNIRRLVEKLDPRSSQVHPIGAPTPAEAAEHYLQRFWRRLPPKGHIAIFDRSWYGRVLVERIEGFATKSEWRRGYNEIKAFEKTLTDDGFVIIKLFLHVSPEEQLRRYDARLTDPRKNWKLTEEDLRNRRKADEYLDAYNDVFRKTHTENAPWALVAGDHKWFARIKALETVVDRLEANINTEIPKLSKEEIAEARKLLGIV